MALSDTEIATVTAEVTARLDDDNLRGDATTRGQVAGHAVARCVEYAPEADADSVREAAWRFAAWSLDTRPALRSLTIASADGTSLTKEFNTSAHAAGFRHSGAAAELTRHVRRRAGAIG